MDDDVGDELDGDAGAVGDMDVDTVPVDGLEIVRDEFLLKGDHYVPLEHDPERLVLDNCMPQRPWAWGSLGCRPSSRSPHSTAHPTPRPRCAQIRSHSPLAAYGGEAILGRTANSRRLGSMSRMTGSPTPIASCCC